MSAGREMFRLLACALFFLPVLLSGRAARAAIIAQVLTRSGTVIEGAASPVDLVFKAGEATKRVSIRKLRSFHSGDPASPFEAERITASLSILTASNEKGPKSTDAACEELTAIGLPVINPLLKAYKDTDAHEPNPLYRLFARLIPGYTDGLNRSLDLIRPVGGEPFRGKLQPMTFRLQTANGIVTIPSSDVRRLAVLQNEVVRSFEMQALHHCSYVGYLDTGIGTTANSTIRAESEGFVRLSFDEDGWASDPDGIADPLPGKRRLQEGFRWGAVLGRVGAKGERWLAGKHVEKSGAGAGRLYFVINDNEHWENNVGAYRVRMRVTNAYDLGDAQQP